MILTLFGMTLTAIIGYILGNGIKKSIKEFKEFQKEIKK